jgi:hypothetical protein
MRHALLVTALAVLLVPVACGAASSASPSQPATPAKTAGSPQAATSHMIRPPAWVEREALWQSLAAGEPHPLALQWRLTYAARAARLAGSATSYLATFDPRGKVYVVVLRGHFRPPDAPGAAARRLYLVLEVDGHGYRAHGLTGARGLDLTRLRPLHTYEPQLPVHDGVWGHTMVAGGPFPGGPRLLARTAVDVWAGTDVQAGERPLTQVRSDGAGFFLMQLQPGAYTFRLSLAGGGPSTPTTATVEAGKPVAVGVYEDVP